MTKTLMKMSREETCPTGKHGQCGPGAGGQIHQWTEQRLRKHTLAYADSGNTHSRTQTPETHTRVRGDSGNTLAYAHAALFSQEDRNDYFDK